MVLKKKKKTLKTVAGKEADAAAGVTTTEGGSGDEPPGDGKADTSNTEDNADDNYQKEVITLLRGMNEGIKKNLECSEGIMKHLSKGDAPTPPAEEEEEEEESEEEEDVEKTISESAAYKRLVEEVATLRKGIEKLVEGYATLAAAIHSSKQDQAA